MNLEFDALIENQGIRSFAREKSIAYLVGYKNKVSIFPDNIFFSNKILTYLISSSI